MDFRVEMHTLPTRIGEPNADCSADNCTEPSGYRVTVESHGDVLHRACCHRHVFEIANELSADLGMVVRLGTIEPEERDDE